MSKKDAAKLKRKIAATKKRVDEDTARLAEMERELYIMEYTDYFDEITSKEIDWKRMCWPTSGNGGYPDYRRCIVCKVGFHRFKGTNYSGCHVGAGFNHPTVQVHEGCMPEWVVRDIKNDIY